LKQITGLCGPRGSKTDAKMDSTLLFVTAGKHDENV
jgi:hypothetical protein